LNYQHTSSISNCEIHADAKAPLGWSCRHAGSGAADVRNLHAEARFVC
jgi:hypothetical protein